MRLLPAGRAAAGPGRAADVLQADVRAARTKLLAIAEKERRFALLTGDNDADHPQTEAYYNAMKKDGFKYVTYLQVPGMGHQQPNAEWFEKKGIVALDEPRDEVAEGQKQQPAALFEEKRPAQAASVKQREQHHVRRQRRRTRRRAS